MNDKETMTYNFYHSNVKPKPQTEGRKGLSAKSAVTFMRETSFLRIISARFGKHGVADFEPIE